MALAIGAGRRFDRLQPALQRRDRLDVLRDVAPTALERALDGLDPERHVGAAFVAAFAAERPGKVGGRRGVPRELFEWPGQGCGQVVEGAVELGGRYQMRAPVVGQRSQRRARQRQAVGRTGGDFRGESAAMPRQPAQALATAMRWPARLPLSTDEM